MYDIHPFVTNDGSIGLYNTETEDIYHSVTGAASEAYNKFIKPSNIDKLLLNSPNLNVLDLCFGIGYNSKILLNYILENFLKNKNKNLKKSKKTLSPCIDTICTYNNFSNHYNDTIYNDNNICKEVCMDFREKFFNDSKSLNFKQKNQDLIKNIKISITCIDNDKSLGFLSPFISCKKIYTENNQEFINDKIKKYKNYQSQKFNYMRQIFSNNNIYSPAINIYIYEYLINTYPEIYADEDIRNILSCKKYQPYFDRNICALHKIYKNQTSKNTPRRDLNTFLHNIYYKYITNSHKNDLKALRNGNINISIKFNDARKALLDDNTIYNVIFLDAFTPSIAPCLWTVDFIKLLYKHTDKDGVVLTYSTAAPVRKAFIDAGYYIGKIYNSHEKKFTGTIASKSKALIEHELSDYELNLLNTKAGITFKDTSLSNSNAQILTDRECEVADSNLLSATEYKRAIL